MYNSDVPVLGHYVTELCGTHQTSTKMHMTNKSTVPLPIYEPSLMPSPSRPMPRHMPKNPINPPQHTRMGRAIMQQELHNHKIGPAPHRQCLKAAEWHALVPAAKCPLGPFYFVVHLSPSSFVRLRRMGSRQYRNHVIQYKLPSPSLRLSPPHQVAQVKWTEGMCRAAGWTLQSWLAVHLSTRGKSRPQGAFSSVQILLVECDMGICTRCTIIQLKKKKKYISGWHIIDNSGQTCELVTIHYISFNRIAHPGHFAIIMCPVYNQVQLTFQNDVPIIMHYIWSNRVAQPGHLAVIVCSVYNQL